VRLLACSGNVDIRQGIRTGHHAPGVNHASDRRPTTEGLAAWRWKTTGQDRVWIHAVAVMWSSPSEGLIHRDVDRVVAFVELVQVEDVERSLSLLDGKAGSRSPCHVPFETR